MTTPLFFDVTEFGADPTGRTDATDAFQRALNEAAGLAGFKPDPKKICPIADVIEVTVPRSHAVGPLPPQGGPRGPTDHTTAEATGPGDKAAFEISQHITSSPSVLSQKSPNVVVAPPGVYRIDGPLVVHAYVTLRGSWSSPPDVDDGFPSPTWADQQPFRPWWDPAEYVPYLHGTVFVTDYGRGCEDDSDCYAFITLMGKTSTLEGVWIYYPWQGVTRRPFPGLKPVFRVVPYQWTIRALGTSCTVQNVLLQNSYSGIDCSAYSGRHILQHIWGQPIREGIRVDNCYDIGRIIDIHFWQFWSHADDGHGDPFLRDFMARHGFALVLYRTDMQIVHDFFAIGYFVGVHLGLSERQDEHRPGGAPSGQFTNLNIDQTINPIDYHATAKSGVQITNANLVCMRVHVASELLRHAIVAHRYEDDRRYEQGFLSVRGASIFGSAQRSMIWWGSKDMLMISSSWLMNEVEFQTDKAVLDSPTIEISRGRAILQGNWFANPKTRAGQALDTVHLGKGAKKVVITDNVSEAGSFPPVETTLLQLGPIKISLDLSHNRVLTDADRADM